ncbi:FAD-binding domain-containing protein [Parathielavia appendiculata]|uniref:FAD-binding domain-containing protein n=1 Tax=Parathielavia appendiculata TaxID=2587402 RepID=A0AAN6U043_9PEZI|nr:FAD-binding domain-containing protein [Parathielavia appendiculata]
MRFQAALSLLFTLGAAAEELEQKPSSQCKCVPGSDCWPSLCEWQTFRRQLGWGKLIKTRPVAESCYDGPRKDLGQCAYVAKMWSDQDFQTSNPVGRPYPYNITCAPVDYAAGQTPTSCILGSLPVYAVNATTRKDISATLEFAKKNNVRLVIASTGHDLLGRSDGYGGLELWLRHFRNGIYFQKTFQSATKCTKSGWTGSALHVDGAWQWRDVYKVAEANNVIAVGGGALSPGAIGGWPSGGGHGPATRNYGLGADQILEAEVMLADGKIVTANHCENPDLFRALRGGGPGYGIVLSQHIKAHPNVNVVTTHRLAIAPFEQTPENADLLDAVAVILQQLPDLNDKGYAGYGYWFRNFPTVFVGNAHSGYTHGFWTIGKGKAEAEAAMNNTLKLLEKFQDKLFIYSSYTEYPDYWSFYHAESGLYDPTGDTSILTSRMIDAKAVSNYTAVRETVEITSGAPEEFASNVILLVSGGQVFKDGADSSSGLHPAWRTSPFVLITGQGIPKVAPREVREYATYQITHVKGAALKKLAPDTGGYMNEGDRHDPDYIQTFYGSNYQSHLAAKKKYDPQGVFYCPSCVGAEAFVERPDGPLCRA